MCVRQFHFSTSRMLLAIMWFAVAFALIAIVRNAQEPSSHHPWLVILSLPTFGAAVGTLFGNAKKGAFVVVLFLVANFVQCGVLIGLLYLIAAL